MALVKDRDYINLKGKDYVLFPALLNLAHERGLEGSASELLQAPNAENKQTAIVIATVTFKGEDGRPKIYSGIGDAGPDTMSNRSITAYVRMAETRALGRALRFALNIGQTMYEELDPDAPDLRGSGEPVRGSTEREAASTERRNGGREPTGELACSHDGCGKELTSGQYKLSVAKFNVALCPNHQREYTAVG